MIVCQGLTTGKTYSIKTYVIFHLIIFGFSMQINFDGIAKAVKAFDGNVKRTPTVQAEKLRKLGCDLYLKLGC